MFTSLATAAEVLMEQTPSAVEVASLAGVPLVRYRTTKVTEYRGLTEAAAIAALDEFTGDVDGNVKVDGAATSPTIHVDGFTNATGLVFAGTGLKIAGDTNVYRVKTSATIAGSEVDLVLTEHYKEPGTIRVNGASQTGSTLAIDGFTNTTGYVHAGTTLSISGVSGTYTVTGQYAFSSSAVTVQIDPVLDSSPADDAVVTLSHPAENADVELTLGGVSASAFRAQGPMFTLRVMADYYDGAFRAE